MGQDERDGSALVDNHSRINIEKPRWDQSNYWGRAQHFFVTTNPLNLLKTNADLDRAQEIVTKYKKQEKLPGVTVDELWKAKQVYDSAFHPETGEKMVLIGRMSAQVPMNMLISGCMMTWYKQLGTSYAMATTGAVGTALGLNRMVKVMPPLIGRFVPFAAVAAANCVNIPMMRRKELSEGIPILDSNGNKLGMSKIAAREGITNVVISRIAMASPYMILIPIYMNRLEKKGFLKRYPWSNAPIQVALCGLILTFATPLCCALFPQLSSISVSSLEPELQDQISKSPNAPTTVFYNKGL
ncbi:unnamed protein product [Notodromas monacha]|uniref:Sidoreflexin n=1 Tax=Notodromas monacha TaxID=399045 RepID=A0A7R9GBG7_9CRUS|nr:unnamed protein product [Notodromas monacha]CAG0914799.1 unnamed protein product [Notodromas monacha]